MYPNNHIFDLEKKVTNGSRNFIGVRKKCQISCHVIFVFLSLTPSRSLNICFDLNPDHCEFVEFIWISWLTTKRARKNCVWRDEAEWKKSITTPNLCICWRFKYTFNRFISNSSFKCCSFQWDLYLNERREIKLRSTSGMQWLTQWYGTPSNICQISWLNWTDGLDRIASNGIGLPVSNCKSNTMQNEHDSRKKIHRIWMCVWWQVEKSHTRTHMLTTETRLWQGLNRHPLIKRWNLLSSRADTSRTQSKTKPQRKSRRNKQKKTKTSDYHK